MLGNCIWQNLSKDALMMIDRVDGADTGEPAERQADNEHVPADVPGSEGPLSRAGSRIGAIAANGENERPEPVHPETVDGEKGPDDRLPPPYAKWLDTPIADNQPTLREVLCRFAPAEAGLSEVTEREAADYIAQNSRERPWLACLKECDPAVQRILVALDQGQGHALERHEGYADDDRLQRRVTALEDPAQLDPIKREAGIDGCKPGERDHRCGAVATAIQDPVAFATAVARGIEHPDVQNALRTPYANGVHPDKVRIPIEDLLGVDGHKYCSGYVLERVGGSLSAAQDCRSAWVDAKSDPDRESDVPPPRCAPVADFVGATIEFFFRATRAKDGYEISTTYVEPPDSALRGG
jgi:hypothetical protein